MRLKILLLLFIMFYSVNCFAGPPKAKFTIKVVDTKGNPIEDADAFASFTGSKAKIVMGKTDKNGIFKAEGETTTHFGVTVDKKGYYRSGYSFRHLLKRGKGFPKRYIPWNPTIEIVLKEIRNPTPMYAKNTSHMKIPVLNEPVGFDLEKGDWVAPYGTGIINDFIFIFKAHEKKITDWECSYKLIFSNENDGIQEYYPDEKDYTEYIWPYKAPETGYEPYLTGYNLIKNGNNETSFDRKRNYIFRVRTKLDSKGNIIETKYGKIRGDIKIYPETVRFTYYFNPTGNRNLEYDKKNPLFKFLTRKEEVHKVSEP